MCCVAPHMQTDAEVGKDSIHTIEDMYNEVKYHYNERYSRDGGYGGWNMYDPDERASFRSERDMMKRFINWYEQNNK